MADVLPLVLRLAPAERQLTHAVSYFAASVVDADPHREDLFHALRQLLPGITPRPETALLLDAAGQLVKAFPRRLSPGGAADWCHANWAAEKVAMRYHWAAFAHLHGGG